MIAFNFAYIVIPLILKHQIVKRDSTEAPVLNYWMQRLEKGYMPIEKANIS